MKREQLGFVRFDLGPVLWAAVACGFAIGVGAAIVLPAAWRWIRPAIHGWTA